ncbi:MAG TPA: TetR/AcrR family transcriptional regulator [Bacteroidales bacterium]|nr:TetR/AcrR family transcriptional regulator [Bacteroidales bacterium]HRZ47835.1 TetR/AcrR family transcriptional regulator [Bacteroidales bacterium]
MKNKELQEQRMRGYFIEATKNLIKGEGIRSVSVRAVADHAGYSFATMYNYFRDLNELIFLCVQDFQEECRLDVEEQVKMVKGGCHERVKARVMAYIRFFTEYPGIFELFFTARAYDLGNREGTLITIERSLENVCKPAWDECLESGTLTVEQAALIAESLRHTVTGMLVMYLNRRRPASYKDFQEMVHRQVDRILKVHHE